MWPPHCKREVVFEWRVKGIDSIALSSTNLNVLVEGKRRIKFTHKNELPGKIVELLTNTEFTFSFPGDGSFKGRPSQENTTGYQRHQRAAHCSREIQHDLMTFWPWTYTWPLTSALRVICDLCTTIYSSAWLFVLTDLSVTWGNILFLPPFNLNPFEDCLTIYYILEYFMNHLCIVLYYCIVRYGIIICLYLHCTELCRTKLNNTQTETNSTISIFMIVTMIISCSSYYIEYTEDNTVVVSR